LSSSPRSSRVEAARSPPGTDSAERNEDGEPPHSAAPASSEAIVREAETVVTWIDNYAVEPRPPSVFGGVIRCVHSAMKKARAT
jgi:hypothetical protein